MTTPNHNDIYRSLGRVEGDVAGMKEDIADIKQAVTKGFEDVGKRLSSLEASESERKGGWRVLLLFGSFTGVVGGLFAKFGAMLLGLPK